MAHFAKVVDGRVVAIIVAEQDFIDSYQEPIQGEWIQTSYNTIGGIHTQGGTPLRKNYAGVGYTYDRVRDAFIPPKPIGVEVVLDENTCQWVATSTEAP
jgi:hypothetical protein